MLLTTIDTYWQTEHITLYLCRPYYNWIKNILNIHYLVVT